MSKVEGSKRVNHADMWKNSILGRKKYIYKPDTEACWQVQERVRAPLCLEQCEQREGS